MISSAVRCGAVRCGAVPDEGLGVVVPVLGPVIDRGDELVEGAEAAAADPLVGDLLEPPFDQVQPRRAGRGEQQVEPAPAGVCQPLGDFLVAVGVEVVQHQMHVQMAGDVQVDELKKNKKSWWRRRGRQCWSTRPVAVSSAAKIVVVP
jgi:hypothetical protein